MEQIKWDIHTHTIYSRNHHGKGTIEEIVQAAVKMGLTKIGISDHGPGHKGYGLLRKKIPEVRRIIDELKPKYPEIEILMGVEANVINRSGALDVRPEEWPYFDYVIAGYHYGAIGEAPVRDLALHGQNWVLNKFGTTTRALKRYNTDLMVRAVMENDIYALAHPGDKQQVYIEEVAKACEEKGVLMEINNSHPFLTAKTIAVCAEYNVGFIIGSDAHSPHRVGHCENAVARLKESGVDPSRVVNL
ncbi:MAG: PHP domain-containing protein [Firmicutes bacterium]|nr:PHP domain-containing protein [Bacillota bacterium]